MKARASFSAIVFVMLAACSPTPKAHDWGDFGGDPIRGAIWVGRSSCGACHVIPGISDAIGQVGPPLTHFSQRTVIAGVLANTPDNLIHWLRQPQAVVPGNAMPNMGLNDREARDIAAYLYAVK